MSQRLNEYFVQEAGEYLEQIERYLSLPNEAPDADHLVRLAHGVRGSAQMAGAESIAQLAERLEGAARSVLARNVTWTEEIRRRSLDTVRDLQVLLRSLSRWGADEEERVRVALHRWNAGGADPEGAAASDNHDSAEAPAGAGVIPISELFYDDGGPHVISDGAQRAGAGEDAAEKVAEQAADDAEEVVAIEALLLRGPAAARSALALRPRLEELARGSADIAELRALHDELFELVTLSLADAQE